MFNPFASTAQLSPIDSLKKDISNLNQKVSILNKIKFSGYAQFQAQFAETKGQKSFNAGSFESETNKRFMLRRGRIKFTYSDARSKIVFQTDMSEKGLSVKDAYYQVTDPWTEDFTFTAGVFMRPFGQELDYSSSKRESPERSRVIQSIFPGERDLGFKVGYLWNSASEKHKLVSEVGLFNGNGPSATEYDQAKDIIGQLFFTSEENNSKFNYRLGASLYNGGFILKNDTVYTASSDGFKASTNNLNHYSNRSYLGFDASASLKSKLGRTTLKGEFIIGTQPGRSNSNTSPTSQSASVLSSPVYEREFMGTYVYLIQDIGKTKHQVVFKYDIYDPNTSVDGDEIGKNNNYNSSDLAYSTIGIGYNYKINSNLSLMLYGDLVANEKAKEIGIDKDFEDNQFTIRLQYKY